MKAIQKELGDDEGPRASSPILEEKISRDQALQGKRARRRSMKLKKLRQMSPMSAEATVVRNYLDWLLSIPWGKKSKVKKDLEAAQAVLDSDHYGLEKVKERIVEYLAVQSRANKLTGPILVASSVLPASARPRSASRSRRRPAVSSCACRSAACVTRPRSAVTAAPISARCPARSSSRCARPKSSNPLFLLDEIDKMGADFRGDPSSALLEVLDPEQNSTFNDHYLEVDYDLSNVMFITTANYAQYSRPADGPHGDHPDRGLHREREGRDRAQAPDPERGVQARPGLQEFSIDDDALLLLIRRYTREAGVRNLERELSTLARKAVKELMISKKKSVKVTEKTLEELLGVPKYRFGEIESEPQVGIVTGLAWTDVGGELLTIEGVMMPGKGKMTVTGNLRDVMKESISAAASTSARGRSPTASSRRCSTAATSTCTCRKARRRRTVRQRAWRWPPRSSRS